MPLNLSELGLNMIRFISNLYVGVFLYRPDTVFSTCMLENDVMVTPTLPRDRVDRVAPVDNRPPTNKNGGPKQWCSVNVDSASRSIVYMLA